jgi:hypothetical protein
MSFIAQKIYIYIFDKCPTLTDAKALEIKFRASGHLIHTELLGIACL